jgi:NADPH:quinone reductase-like Zn-dependent oxidoreductase
MNAIEAKAYGTPAVFQLNEITKPVPAAGELLVRVHATTVTAADIMMRRGKPVIGRLYLGLFKPKKSVLGFEFAGEVVETGTGVNQFKTGDRVYGGTTALGCYAEYVCVKQDDVLAVMPETLSYAEAAPVTGSAITALHFLKALGKLKQGQQVLINGASGGLGTYALQLAKLHGATVTAVCSGKNRELVKSLGADEVIDYTTTDFTQSSKTYDLIFDTVGKRSYASCRKVLVPGGIYLSAVVSMSLLLHILIGKLTGRRKATTAAVGMLPVKKRLAYLQELNALLATGQLKTEIDRTYPLNEMAAAHTYVEAGHKKGSVVITV